VENLQRLFFAGGSGMSVANVSTMVQRAPEIVVLMDAPSLQQRLEDRARQLRELLPRCEPLRLIKKAPTLLLEEYVHAQAVCDRLREELGESLDLGRVIYANPALLTRQDVQERIEDLRALFPPVDLGKLISRRPDLLSRDVGKVKQKMEGLAALMPEVDVIGLVEKCPELLGRNLSLIESNLDGLRRFFSHVDLPNMLCRKPSLLLASTDKVIAPKLARLAGLLGGPAATKVASLQPTIFNRDVEKIAARVEVLREALPGVDVVRFVLGFPGFLVMEGDVGERLRRLEEALLPAEHVQVLSSEPRIFNEDLQGAWLGGWIGGLGGWMDGLID
jgi:hypothetical protein